MEQTGTRFDLGTVLTFLSTFCVADSPFWDLVGLNRHRAHARLRRARLLSFACLRLPQYITPVQNACTGEQRPVRPHMCRRGFALLECSAEQVDLTATKRAVG